MSFAQWTSVALYRAKHAAGEWFLRLIAAVEAESSRASNCPDFHQKRKCVDVRFISLYV
jgi:hypothetical protein